MRYLLAIILTSSFLIASAQKAVKLTNTESNKTIILKQGKRVVYSLKNDERYIKGELDAITESTLTIGGEEIGIEDFDAFGRNNKGNRFWSTASIVLGAGAIVASVQNSNYDPCPSCTQGESSGGGYAVLEIGIGLALIGNGINTIVRNKPRDLTSIWKLEIIPAP